MNQHIKTGFGALFLIADVAVMLFGFYVMIHSARHFGEGSETGNLGIEGVFSIAGPTHLIEFGVGAAIVGLALSYAYKSMRPDPQPDERRIVKRKHLKFSPTEDGKRIVEAMRRFSPR